MAQRRRSQPNKEIKPEKRQLEAENERAKGFHGIISFFKLKLSLGWFLLSILISLLQFANSYKPKISIEVGPSLDDKNPMSSLFRVTNVGPLPLLNLHFTCKIMPLNSTFSGVTIISGAPASTGLHPVARLESGDSATRDCVVGSIPPPGYPPLFAASPVDPASIKIDVIVDYEWPYLAIKATQSKHFSTRRSSELNRFVLVPDIEH